MLSRKWNTFIHNWIRSEIGSTQECSTQQYLLTAALGYCYYRAGLTRMYRRPRAGPRHPTPLPIWMWRGRHGSDVWRLGESADERATGIRDHQKTRRNHPRQGEQDRGVAQDSAVQCCLTQHSKIRLGSFAAMEVLVQLPQSVSRNSMIASSIPGSP